MKPEMKIFNMGNPEERAAYEEHQRQHNALVNQGQQLYAVIRETSKYYGQTEPGEFFPVFVSPDYGLYAVQGGPGGQYRLEDVILAVKGSDRHLVISS